MASTINGVSCYSGSTFHNPSDAFACTQELTTEGYAFCGATKVDESTYHIECSEVSTTSGCAVSMGATPSRSVIQDFLKWIGLVD